MTMRERELVKLWERNKKKYPIPSPYEITHGSRRRPRGPDFVDELTRLGSVTQDKRFRECVAALYDHKIVDSQKNFTRWCMPVLVEQEKALDQLRLATIRVFLNNKRSLRMACAETAAAEGLRAGTFDAAIKRLQKLHKASRAAE